MDDLTKELEEQKIKKLNEMRSKKQEYTSGMWNAQTVLLGGLGKDPDVEGRIYVLLECQAAAVGKMHGFQSNSLGSIPIATLSAKKRSQVSCLKSLISSL